MELIYRNLVNTVTIASLLLIGSSSTTMAATSLGVDYTTLDPVGWSVGDANTTHQLWDAKVDENGQNNNPDTTPESYDAGSATLTMPSHGASGAIVTGTHNFYSWSGDYQAYADIYTQGGSSGSGSFDSTYGTHVIIQIAGSLNGDTVIDGSLSITDLIGGAITGGSSAEMLYSAQTFYDDAVPSSIGAVEYEATIFEFWLPGYIGDFRVQWTEVVHSTVDVLRVDSIIAQEALGGGTPFASVVPEPASLVLMTAGLFALAARRRSRS